MVNKIGMKRRQNVWSVSGWIFSSLVFTVGVLNMLLVHPVPGLVYLLLSLIYLPPVNAYIRKKFGFSIAPVVKILLGILLFMFTFGVSDLGDMID